LVKKPLIILQLRRQLVSMYNKVEREKTNSYKERDQKSTSKYIFEEKLTNYKKSSDLLFKHRDQDNYKLLIQDNDYLKQKGDMLDYTSKIVNERKDFY